MVRAFIVVVPRFLDAIRPGGGHVPSYAVAAFRFQKNLRRPRGSNFAIKIKRLQHAWRHAVAVIKLS
jgi:hypothetical protein